MNTIENNLKEGEILFADGKIDEAEELFLSVAEKDKNNKEAYNNLGVIAIQKEDVKSAIECFTRALEIDPFYKTAILNYTDLLKTLNQSHIAVPLLEKIAEINPTDKEIAKLLKNIRSSVQVRLKIAVLCLPGLESFLKDIVDFLKARHDVRVCYSTNGQEIEAAIKWADTIWLEWANDLAVKLTNHPTLLEGKRVICRLHSYEALAGFATKINWKNICDLIFVAKHIKDIVIQQVPNLPDVVRNVHIVPNGIDMNKFSFKDRSRGRNLAFIGYVNSKKGPVLLLHAFRELVQKDDKYRLFVAGGFQETRYQLYFDQMIKEMGLEDNIRFDGWVKDINSWLEDKQYIVCTSVLEGHPVGIMEAMARGLKPLIHNFVGARGIYPGKYIWNTIPEFVDMVTEDDYDSMEYRKFIETHYSLEIQLERVKNIISSIDPPKITKIHSEKNTKKENENSSERTIKVKIKTEREHIYSMIEIADQENNRYNFLRLWYYYHYLPKIKYNCMVDWYASLLSIKSINKFSKKFINYHKEKISALTPGLFKYSNTNKKKILYILEGYDFNNPVLRHLFNMIAYGDKSRLDFYVVCRFSEIDLPIDKRNDYMVGVKQLKEVGCNVVNLNAHEVIDKIDEIINTINFNNFNYVVYQTGFQVSFLIYIANIISAIAPDVKQIAYQWDYIEKGADKYSPFDLILTCQDSTIDKLKYKQIKKIKYLYGNPNNYDDCDGEIPVDFFTFLKSSKISRPVIVGTMVGQSRLRGNDALFWDNVSQVLKQVDNSILLVIGMTNNELDMFIPPDILSSRVFATGYVPNYLKYLKSIDIYLDTFKSGGTSLLEAYENGIPIFIKKSLAVDEAVFNLPNKNILLNKLLTVDGVNDYVQWQKKLIFILRNPDKLELLKKEFSKCKINNESEVIDEVKKVYGFFESPNSISPDVRHVYSVVK